MTQRAAKGALAISQNPLNDPNPALKHQEPVIT